MTSSERKVGFSITIPSWNDAQRLQHTLPKLVHELRQTLEPFEILIVEDGDHSATAELVMSLRDDRILILGYPSRLGKGRAITEGLLASKYSRIGFIDADCPLDPKEVIEIARLTDFHHAALASRWAPGHGPTFHASLTRNVLSVLWSSLARFLLLTRLRDGQCGAKFFQGDRLKPLLSQVLVRGWAFDLSLMYHWQKAGYLCKEVQVTWPDIGDSKLEKRTVVPVMLAVMLSMRVANSPLARLLPRRVIDKARSFFGDIFHNAFTA